ncbi:inositol monophosphatase family protein [Oricola sp.]|uniref:inositol monophosphatase family protein n=1 Tax=Oricola sp. TaxID=1979950 RepID=UPI003BAC7C55
MTNPTNQQRLTAAISITELAAQIAQRHFRRAPDIEIKQDLSPVTVADKETEEAIRAGLAEHFPGEAVFGEEFGRDGDAETTWIIDPIDGTRSFIGGVPLYGMLLGYLEAGRPTLGVIRMPAIGEVYAGGTGLQATCNGAPIHVSRCKSLAEASLFINEGDKLAIREPAVFARLVEAGRLRRMGADCHPHALVAAGTMDAVVDYDLQPYDYLPVSAVVEAAGGVMTDWQGKALGLNSDGRTLTAATPELHAELMELVNARS